MKLSHTDRLSRSAIFAKLLAAKNGAELGEYGLDCLINYFAPSVPKKPKDAFDWVAKAVADDRDVRKYLMFVYVEDGEMVATNGNRMHIAKTSLPNGFYDPRSRLQVEVDAKYPQYKRVVPKLGTMECDGGRKCWMTNATQIKGKEIFYVTIGDVNVNRTYLDESLATFAGVHWSSSPGPAGQVSGECEFGRYIIQGMRV